MSSLTRSDICICVLSGGGSALLPAPIDRLPLDEKIRLTRLMKRRRLEYRTAQHRAATIKLSERRKAGARLHSRLTITLAISDVLGDLPDIIASGPTVLTSRTAVDALAVLEELNLVSDPTITSLVQFLRNHGTGMISRPVGKGIGPPAHMSFHVLGNNAAAVDGAGVEAERLGYSHAMTAARKSEGSAEEVGRHLAAMARRMRR